MPRDYHAPLHDLYAQLLSGVKEKSREEFGEILEEESVEAKLKAIDEACERRGVRLDRTVEEVAKEVSGTKTEPEEAARAARADAKRRELELLRREAEDAKRKGDEALEKLEEKRRELGMAAGAVGRAQNELEMVRDASLQWAGRQSY